LVLLKLAKIITEEVCVVLILSKEDLVSKVVKDFEKIINQFLVVIK
jgi:hypothetical protein